MRTHDEITEAADSAWREWREAHPVLTLARDEVEINGAIVQISDAIASSVDDAALRRLVLDERVWELHLDDEVHSSPRDAVRGAVQEIAERRVCELLRAEVTGERFAP